MTRGICTLVVLVAALLSCAHGKRSPAPNPKSSEAKARALRTPPPPDWFWEPVDADVRPRTRADVELPVADADLVRLEGAARVWDDLPPDARERLRRDGILVVGTENSPEGRPDVDAAAKSASTLDAKTRSGRWTTMGAFYNYLREQRVPTMLTLDALYVLVHLALERALADVEELDLAPKLNGLLERLDAQLGTDEQSASAELADAYRIARGVAAVARALAAPPADKTGRAKPSTPYVPPPELAVIVAEERGHIEGHAGFATSSLLGVRLDYSRFQVPSSAIQPGMFRALAWLAAAPFSLLGRSEAPGSPVNIAQARTDTRAAMLLARLCDRDVDLPLYNAYSSVLRLLAFVWGPPDDLSLVELDEIATSAGIDLTKQENILNVTRVDKVRSRALAGRAPAAYDGSGGLGRAGVSVRLFGGHASADSLVLQGLVGAPVGLAREAASQAPIDRLRKGQRVLPSALDVIAWLGVPEARALLHETHADAFDGYDAALAGLQRTRPGGPSSALHASIHGSLVDSLIAWATPDVRTPIHATVATERSRVESMLAAWTLMRHAGQALGRTRAAPSPNSAELRVSNAALPVFVEAQPEVIARLVAVVRQARRGLEALGTLPPPSTALLVEVEDILRAALKGAERYASDEALSTEEAAALASLPARLARVEDDSSAGPVVAIVYSDPTSRRVLATATGTIEPALMLAREPKREEPLLVVGAHLAHHEVVEGFANSPGVLHAVRPALTDVVWRSRTRSGGPPRAAWVSSFRWTKPRPAEAPPPTQAIKD